MKKILLSLAVIAIVGVATVGATRAYFSNTALMSGNTFTAGTLDLQIDQNVLGGTKTWVDNFNTTSDSFKAQFGSDAAYQTFLAQSGLRDLVPGDTKQQIIDIKNNGSVDGTATIKFDASGNSHLINVLKFTVYYDEANNGFDGSEPIIATGNLSDWNGNTYNLGDLDKTRIASVKIVWSVPTTAGNEIQGAAVSVATTFGLDQVK